MSSLLYTIILISRNLSQLYLTFQPFNHYCPTSISLLLSLPYLNPTLFTLTLYHVDWVVFGFLPSLWPSDPGRSLLLPNMPSSRTGWHIGWNVTKIECIINTLVRDQPGPSSSRNQYPRRPQSLTNPIRLLISNLPLFTEEQHIQFQCGRSAPGWIAWLCVFFRPSPRPETAHDYHIISIRTRNSKNWFSNPLPSIPTSGWGPGYPNACSPSCCFLIILHILGNKALLLEKINHFLFSIFFFFSFSFFPCPAWSFSRTYTPTTVMFLYHDHRSWIQAQVPRLIMYLTRLPITNIGNLDDIYIAYIIYTIYFKKKHEIPQYSQ